MSRWFRFYDGVLDDPKVQRLDPELFKAWVNLLCLASRHDGKLPSVGDIAFALRIDMQAAERLVADLTQAGLIDQYDEQLHPHNWNGRQFKSDVTDPTAAVRQKRYRNNKRNADCNATVTVTATRTDTEQNRESARKRATRLPNDWVPSSIDRDFAKSLGFLDSQIDHHAARFRDFWHAKPGAGGTKLDWPATWRNWMRTEAANKPPKPKDDWRNPMAGIV